MSKEFKRAEYFRYKKLGEKWRKPRGKHHKMRKYIGGKLPSPATGYATKAELRYLHPSGYREVLVHNLKDLESVDREKQAVRISGKVGKRKREIILKEAEKLKLKVL
ncbi:MAG: 50S ribosomal protein L32e [Candidatus Hydrothermarchaeota archaeon]|nr:50S ribosomal protein L32e [Candidatus Hydrothermarchaeota archaeon]